MVAHTQERSEGMKEGMKEGLLSSVLSKSLKLDRQIRHSIYTKYIKCIVSLTLSACLPSSMLPDPGEWTSSNTASLVLLLLPSRAVVILPPA